MKNKSMKSSKAQAKALAKAQAKAALPAVVKLNKQQLDAVRSLAAEGSREHTIRRALGLSPQEWKILKEDEEGELSPLSLALEEGRAEGAGNVISFMKNKMMNEGDIRAAEFLADRVFKLNKGDGNSEDVPRVQIFINAALSPEEYARVIRVQQS